MPNRLADETSPYLLQHAHNPVDWYAWGAEALQRARAEDKPILLSVGYSACHWCHVMERESFENPQIASLMNEHFVNIKVDREERPDIDAIYMQAVQALSGRGGWPMTVFLTPDGRPFHGGTYFPPEDRHGMPGFPRVLMAIAQAYRERREDVLKAADQLTAHLEPGIPAGARDAAAGNLTPALLDEAAQRLASQFDATNGGFGGAPKFPAAMTLDFLLRHHVRTGNRHSLEMVQISLDKMARGGIYDQLGGGFHRYAVDDIWLVPHFEKMLYDNALLARLYLRAFQVTGNPFYRRIAEETIDYVLREMTHPDGGFYSSQDADSEGEEGKFFTWTTAQLAEVLGADDARLIAQVYGASDQGNFEHTNVLHRPVALAEIAGEHDMPEAELTERVERARRWLFEAREGRIKPGRDDKVLTAWNGLMLRSLAEAAAVLEREDYARAAVKNAEFLLRELRRGDMVLRTWKDGRVGVHGLGGAHGRAPLPGYLEDYALLADALLAVYSLTFDGRWLREAIGVARTMVDRFWEDDSGLFYDTAADAERLIVRPRDVLDNATPSGSSVATGVLLRLAAITGEADDQRRATSVLSALRDAMARHPTAFGELLGALDFYLGPTVEVTVIGAPGSEDTRALVRNVYGRFRPTALILGRAPDDRGTMALSPLFEGREPREGRATAYVCVGYTCSPPATEPAELASLLDETR
jgi:uncharacterized protein YyaL (SSP411 family)